MRSSSGNPSERTHGPHTLKVWTGTVVGVHGDDVFVELGPRMQGVISLREFADDPALGDQFDFTLRGKEESLWALRRAEDSSLRSWEDMEPGCLVPGRALRVVEGGLQLKVGRLHAFLPRSQSGVPRGKKVDGLVGKNFTVEVIEVDPERQRVIVSRKSVLRREREQSSQREVDRLAPGQIVHGRVTRIEEYGAFVAFGRGLEGLVHVSNIAHERVEHPGDVLKLGESVKARVLWIRRGGKRIGLGIKQLEESPWRTLERENYEGQIVEGTVTRLADFGGFVAVRTGVEGLVPHSELGHGGRRNARQLLATGQRVSVRIVTFDAEHERLKLSLLHSDGAQIAPEEARRALDFAEYQDARRPGTVSTNLGHLLRRALEGDLDSATGTAG